jgi:hypothetical protein
MSTSAYIPQARGRMSAVQQRMLSEKKRKNPVSEGRETGPHSIPSDHNPFAMASKISWTWIG